jgi:hypothetical protein
MENREPPSVGQLENRDPIFLLEVGERVERPIYCIWKKGRKD